MTFKNETAKQWATYYGFSLVGITPAIPGDDGDKLLAYLEEGRQGQMDYLQRNVAIRSDSRLLVDGAKSVISLAMNYYQQAPVDKPKNCGQVARYAWGRDYHKVLKKRMKRLALKIGEEAKMNFRCFVDSGPVLEKSLASRAGLGWIGKNNLLINKKYGSWLVLGEIICDLEFDVYDKPIADDCGSCRKCIDACPTGALLEGCGMDARKCISYWTTEADGDMPPEIKAKATDNFFGCDICQDVCPYNQEPVMSEEDDFQIRHAYVDLDEIALLPKEKFKEKFIGSCIRRKK